MTTFLNAKEYISHTLLNLFVGTEVFKLSREGHMYSYRQLLDTVATSVSSVLLCASLMF